MEIGKNTSDLPIDIIYIILSRVPVKSLLRFKTVSKSWNAMISDPAFIQIHLQRSKNSNSQNLFLWKHSPSDVSGFSLVKLEDRKFQTEALLERPYGWNPSAVLCSCDGVILLSDFSCHTYTLWNPSINMETMIWLPYRFNDYPKHYGLCNDPTIMDFKVVIISWKYYAVFSCKNRSWGKRKEFSYASGRLSNSPGLSIDGAIYWIWTDRQTYTKEIIYFDPIDDKFEILQKPKHVKGGDNFFLSCLRGCLCLYYNTRYKTTVEIWINENGRDKNSWTELMTIENVMTPLEWFKPVCFLENKIVIRLGGGEHVIYNPCEKSFEEVDESEVFGLRLAVLCLDSLFFPIQNTRPKRKRKCLYSQLDYAYE